MSRAFLGLDPELRVACGAVLLGVAAADGVIDDDELLPILGDLDLDTLPEDAVQRLASWVIHPPAVDGFASALASQSGAVRFGLVARLLEIAGTDAFLAPGELERLTHAAHLLGVDDDQLGALRVFVSEMALAGGLPPGDPVRRRRIAAAGEGLAMVGAPWGVVAFCAAVSALGAEADLLAPTFGFPPGWSLAALLGSDAERARDDVAQAERMRSGLERLTAVLDAVPDPSVGVRRRALARRLKSMPPAGGSGATR